MKLIIQITLGVTLGELLVLAILHLTVWGI